MREIRELCMSHARSANHSCIREQTVSGIDFGCVFL